MQKLTDLGGGDALEQRHRARVEAELLEQGEVAAALAPEAEVRSCDDDLGADPPQAALRELLGLECCQVERELDDERLVHSRLGEQLEPPLERRQQLDPVPERDAWVGPEGDGGRAGSGGRGGLEHAAMAEVDAVEGAERDGAAGVFELGWVASDLHPSRASACSGGTIVSGSASATVKGPTSVRRSSRQWPPSASAIART